MRRVTSAGILLLTCLFAMPADYQIKTVKVLPIESYPARLTVNGIAIAANPYSTDEKCLTAFDIKGLNSRGYYPIHIIIQNTTQDFLQIRTQQIVLLTKEAQSLYATSSALVVDDVVKSGFGGKLPKMKTQDRNSLTRVGSPALDFADKELKNGLLEPGKVLDGFLFFYTPDPKKSILAGSILIIPPLMNEGGRKGIGPFSIALDPALAPAASP